MKDRVQIVAVPIHAGLRPWLFRLGADTLHLLDKRHDVLEVRHAFDQRILAKDVEEHIFQQLIQAVDMLFRPP